MDNLILTPIETAALLERRDRYLILTHRRPDGDTAGSAAALCNMLRGIGKTAYVAPNEDATPRYLSYIQALYPPAEFAPQVVVAVDIASESLLCPSMETWKGKISICIDHHPSNTLYAEANLVDSAACATGEIIWQLARACGFAPTPAFMEAVYLAVVTDTGGFRYPGTTALSHRIAAACFDGGVDFDQIHREFLFKRTKRRGAVEALVMNSLVFSTDEAVGGAFVCRADIDRIGADDDDLDNLVNIITGIEGVQCAILATENAAGRGCKLSVRTRAPLDASSLCGRFGGGGHARAAGCNLAEPPQKARDTLMAAAVGELRRLSHV